MSGQVKLLRVLEAHEIQRVGSDAPIAVDTRVVAATNRDLRKLCEEGRFREDLFYRLSVIHITLPPLRERKDEIPLLFEFFCDEAAEALKRRPIEMSRPLRQFLLDYAYPGNIRELRNIIYRLSCLAGRTADLEHLPTDIRPAPPVHDASAAPGGDGHAAGPAALGEAKRAASDQAEREFLERALQEVGGVVTELAKRYDMNRSHVQTLLKKHGIRSKDCRNGNTSAARRSGPDDRCRRCREARFTAPEHRGAVGAVQVFGADHHCRDVVASAALERQIDQRLRGLPAIARQQRLLDGRSLTSLLRPSLHSRKTSPSMTSTAAASIPARCPRRRAHG